MRELSYGLHQYFFVTRPEQWLLPTPCLETRVNKITNAVRKGLRNLSIQQSTITTSKDHTETSSIKGIGMRPLENSSIIRYMYG